MRVYNPFKAIRAQAWFSPTHSYIFENSFELLKARREDIYKVLLPLKNQIAKYVLVPDFKGDINKGSGSHYYSPVLKNGRKSVKTEGYYKNRLGRFSRSARTMCEENITLAAIYYVSGNDIMFAECLGRALHFIMDICCTVHTTNLISLPHKKNPHHMYEIYSRANMERFNNNDIQDLPAFEQKYMPMPIGRMFGELAEKSSKFYEDMVSLDSDRFYKALSEMLPISFAAAYVLTVKIFEYVKNYNGVKIGDSFRLCSKGRYLCRRGKKTYLSTYKETAAIFTLVFNNNKLFLRCGREFLVSEGRFGFSFSEAGDYDAVRITKTDKGYLISTEYSSGERYIEADLVSVKARFFNPSICGFYWSLKKV